jgi:REP element-mobilizing transposase RayT
MARRLRLQFKGAMYHVINRGNYRRNVFATVGAAQAFESVLHEVVERFGWQLSAYVIMRNHYHLAFATPNADLVDGMHWLQGTFASRFNRFRDERGHLFQGRYRALLVENQAALANVVDYIHLNPVRAKIVMPEHVAKFRWSSLRRFVGGEPPKWLSCEWLSARGCDASGDGRRAYLAWLADLSANPREQETLGFKSMSNGWAIGTAGWRKAIAKEYAHLALSAGLSGQELREMKEVRWQEALSAAMSAAGKTAADSQADARNAPWKLQIAQLLRGQGTSCQWIASSLNMGTAGALRVNLCRLSNI